MTETDKPYLLEHYRKKTTTNVNLLSLTESDWIWPKEIFLLILPQRWKYTIEVDQKKKILLILPQQRLMLTKYIVISIFGHIHTIIFIVVGNIYCILNFRSYSHDHFGHCGKYILYSQFSVIFKRSFSSLWKFFGQVHKVSFCRSQFSVMFKFFGHIHSVILIRSSEYPSSYQHKFA